MARVQEAIPCPMGVWTEISNSDITAATVQALKGAVAIRGTVGAVAPLTEPKPGLSPGYVLQATEGLRQAPAASFGAGVTRLYAYPVSSEDAIVFIDHA